MRRFLTTTVASTLLLTACGASPTSTPSADQAPPRDQPPARAAAAPAFTWAVRPATANELGKSWRAGCPVGPADLRIVVLSYWNWEGRPTKGTLVLHRDVVARAKPVFALMYEGKWPLRSVRPVTSFGASDDRSMAADNTSAFNCRRAVNTSKKPSWSNHAYGRAIDVNPRENPYLLAGKVLPKEGRPYVNRSRRTKGLIRRGDAVHTAFVRAGFGWGGDFRNPDYQHFER